MIEHIKGRKMRKEREEILIFLLNNLLSHLLIIRSFFHFEIMYMTNSF